MRRLKKLKILLILLCFISRKIVLLFANAVPQQIKWKYTFILPPQPPPGTITGISNKAARITLHGGILWKQ